MAYDGVVLRAVETELNNNISGCKIDKVNQPEKDELIINIRGRGKNFKLLLSSSSNNPRAYLTGISKINPMSPPMFCMLLRKHIQGGIIKSIKQVDMERILIIEIDSADELGTISTKELIVEIMNKHSNIILVKKECRTIIDSIKRIPASISSVRQVLPGLTYIFPPSQDKISPIDYPVSSLNCDIQGTNGNIKLFRFLYTKFLGLSPLLARELCFRARIDSEINIHNLSESELSRLEYTFLDFYKSIKDCNFKPTIVREPDTNDVFAFSAVSLTQFTGFPSESTDSMSEVLEKYFSERDNQDRIKQKSSDLRKTIMVKLERLMNKTTKQEIELRESKNREKYKTQGDLLTANIYRINRGDSEVTVENYYSENLEKITIKLNPQLSPAENAQKFYKRYNKLKHADSLLTNQISQAKSEAEYLENIVLSIDNATTVYEIDEIREELIKQNYLKSYHLKNDKKKQRKQEESKPHNYLSSDGSNIYVGKNNKQNDYLTLRFAEKSDYWFHTKDLPGSHVILKTDGKLPSESDIREAALLASYFSKGKDSSNVAVDYTERKNVRKPGGSRPGMVIYDSNKTIYVTPEKKEINKLKKKD